jgi:outer membrane protein TolC
MRATRNGRLVEERLLTIGWGGQEEIVVVGPAIAVAIAELQRVVDLKAKAVELVRQQVQAGFGATDELAAAEIDLIEAKIQLADAREQAAEIPRLLGEIVSKQEQRLAVAKRRQAAGQASIAEVDQAEMRLANAKQELAKAMEAKR